MKKIINKWKNTDPEIKRSIAETIVGIVCTLILSVFGAYVFISTIYENR
jgi:hypothetical protein